MIKHFRLFNLVQFILWPILLLGCSFQEPYPAFRYRDTTLAAIPPPQREAIILASNGKSIVRLEERYFKNELNSYIVSYRELGSVERDTFYILRNTHGDIIGIRPTHDIDPELNEPTNQP